MNQRVHVTVDRLVFRGFRPADRRSVAHAFQAALKEALATAMRDGSPEPHNIDRLSAGPLMVADGTSVERVTELGAWRLAKAIGS